VQSQRNDDLGEEVHAARQTYPSAPLICRQVWRDGMIRVLVADDRATFCFRAEVRMAQPLKIEQESDLQ
jgi:hypothetical protein